MFEELLPVLHSGNLVVLTGAGVSAESGIKTFRDSNGLWENHDVHEVASPEGFQKDPHLVNRFYNLRRAQLKEVKPNSGHLALAELETLLGDRFFLITQNVDNLHERAGSKRILHMHGELSKIRCTATEDHVRESDGDITPEMRCSFLNQTKNSCNAPMRPHIVWFGEMPMGMGTIKRKVEECKYFISIGTSGVVYPAAGLVNNARYVRATTIEMNLENTGGPFDYRYQGKFGTLFPQLLERLKKG